jgi:hypothetical protein
MPITTQRTSTDGYQASNGAPPATARPRPAGRRPQLPLVVVGVLLVIGCALAFTDASLHLGSREEVLVVTQPLAAGQVLTPGDLRAAKVSTGSGLAPIPVTEESSVVGRSVAVPLVAGALLTSGEVGAASPVGSGSDVVALALKAGSFPPDLAAGDRVQVVPVSSSSSSSGTASATSGSPVAATVLAVEAASPASGGPTVFSLQVSTGDADEVASLAAANQASLVQVGAGG